MGVPTRPTLRLHADLFVALSNWRLNTEIALYTPKGRGSHPDGYPEDGCFVGRTYERLGGVGVLHVDFPAGAGMARFRFALYDNPNSLPAVAIPKTIFVGYPRHP